MKLLPFILAALCATTAVADDLKGLLAPLSTAPTQRAASGFRATATASFAEEPEVVNELKMALADRFQTEGELRVNFARPWTRLRLPSGARWQLELLEAPPSGLAASMMVQFSITQGDQKIGTWSCFIRAQLWKPAWIASRRIDRGMVLEQNLFTSRPMDVLREAQTIVPDNTDLSGYELAQTVSAGRPLAWRDISPKPLVRKGQIVDVTAGEGTMAITIKALAQGNGAAGDIITVRNLESRRDFPAKVTGTNSAQVVF